MLSPNQYHVSSNCLQIKKVLQKSHISFDVLPTFNSVIRRSDSDLSSNTEHRVTCACEFLKITCQKYF
jgi:hypothetical protein